MNKIVLFLLCVITISTHGQNLQDHYVAKKQTDGTLYFIFPFTLFEQAGQHEGLTMDITYKSGNDSATINFTYYQKKTACADSVLFSNSLDSVSARTEKIYIEVRKMPVWEHRYSLKLPFQKLNTLFSTNTPTTVTLYSQGEELIYTPKKAIWTKHTKIISTILDMIQL